MTMQRLPRLLLCLSLCGASAAAQPGREGPPPARDRSEDATLPGPATMSADALRERLERRLLELQQEEAAIVRAQAELQRGASPGEVMRGLMRDRAFGAAERLRDGPGPRGAQEPAEVEYDPQRLREMLRFLRETAPQIADRVEAEIVDDPERAEQVYRRMAPRMLPQMEMRERDPELFTLRADSMRLDWQIRQAAQRVQRVRSANQPPAGELDAANNALRGLIAQRIDLTARERAVMIDRLERRVAEMRRELEESPRGREEQVEQIYQEVLDQESRRSRQPGPRGRVPRPE